MDELNDQRQQRLKKLETLRGFGVEPYGRRFHVKDRAGLLIRAHGKKPKEVLEKEQIQCTLAGRLVVAWEWLPDRWHETMRWRALRGGSHE